MSGRKPVGLLWDSISNNTGDIAIGMLLKRFCEVEDIHSQVVDPFDFSPTDYSTFIIGGGQVLRKSDDLFYQSFRIPGPQILNSVGLHEPDHLEYLRDYQLVSVRSQAEREILLSAVPDLSVDVSPCNTIQLEKYFAEEIEELRKQNLLPSDCIGIHLNNTTLRKIPGIMDALQELNRRYQLVFIPFTHYENDRLLMETLAKWLPGSSVSAAEDPLSIFAAIGKLKGMISSSMHAAIFAYLQNVPVLAFPQDHKLRYFFEERGFHNCLYETADMITPRLEKLLERPPDYRRTVKADKDTVDAHLAKIRKLVIEPGERAQPETDRFAKNPYNDLRRSYYSNGMHNILQANAVETQLLNLEQQLKLERQSKLESEQKLGERVASPKTEMSPLQRNLIKLRQQFSPHNRKWINLIKSSELFDESWYLSHCSEAASSRLEPARHYLLFGGFEGHDPGPNFSSAGYLEAYPDVRKSGQNPLVHYLSFGKSEGRLPKS